MQRFLPVPGGILTAKGIRIVKRRAFIQTGLAAASLAVTTRAAFARTPWVYTDMGIAIRGADPVAYFRDGRAVEGSGANAVRWHGAIWLFATPENQARFEARPKEFAPQFGGFCAYGMSEGDMFPPDPDAFALREGRLYLTNSPELLAKWQSDPGPYILKARANWALLHA